MKRTKPLTQWKERCKLVELPLSVPLGRVRQPQLQQIQKMVP